MSNWVFELIIIFMLILLNGVLSMAEIALVSARQNRLQQKASEGDEKSRVALSLAQNPSTFLSTVQVGITLIGVLTSAFGGARIARNLQAYFESFPVLAPYSEAISLTIVVVMITYFTLVLGELAPKRLGLNRPETIARSLALPMQSFSRLVAPVVKLLSASTEFVLRLFRVRPSSEPEVTDDDVRALLQQGAKSGVFEAAEEDMVSGIFRLSDIRAGALMTPRSQIVWLDLEDPPQIIKQKIIDSAYSRFPVARGGLDDWLGIVLARTLLSQILSSQSLDLTTSLTKPLVIPESMPALRVLEIFKQSGTHVAFVIDEFGVLQGLVTIFDILEAIVGDIPDAGEATELLAVSREDGSWLLDGTISIDQFKEIFQISRLPSEKRGLYQTLAGFILTYLGRIPSSGDRFEWSEMSFEIVDMDGFRIDKVIVNRLPHAKRGDNLGE